MITKRAYHQNHPNKPDCDDTSLSVPAVEFLTAAEQKERLDWAVYEKCKRVIGDCGLSHEYYQEALKNLAESLGL